MFEKNTPRDFFLHVGAFVALYCAAIALTTIAFSVINYKFADLLAGYYTDPYSGPMRFAMASLLILAPIAVYLFYVIQGESRTDPTRRSLGVRKWLTYITLFVAGGTVVIDLIILLNSFLGGSLPSAFLLKVLTILAVMGFGFGYFFLDIRGYWVAHPDYSRFVGIGGLVAVLVAVVGGMMIIGSPVAQREFRVDNQQVQDLDFISGQVLEYWRQNKELPESLATLENPLIGFVVPVAPEGQPPYEYTITGPLAFELCATFLQNSPQEFSYPSYSSGFVELPEWDHGVGYTCFTRTIDPRLVMPTVNIAPVPMQAPLK